MTIIPLTYNPLFAEETSPDRPVSRSGFVAMERTDLPSRSGLPADTPGPAAAPADTTAQDRVAQDRVTQDAQIRETVKRERSRLSDFIRRRMPDPDAAEDILQDVFYELTEAYRLTKPIERVASWLFAVARNKISDWYRRPKSISIDAPAAGYDADDDEAPFLADFLASADDDPDNAFFRETFLDALGDALDELPNEQREVFVRHEIDGQSFKDMSAELGVSVNTLLSRKRYAVLHLRERLQELYDELID